MIQSHFLPGIWLPDHVPPEKWDFSRRHVQSVEWALKNLPQARRRVAFQAGGNIGLWPKRMAEVMASVITCEPDSISRECLRANTPRRVEVYGCALGDQAGISNLKRSSTGSHRVMDVGPEPTEPLWALEPPTKPRDPRDPRCESGIEVRTIDSFSLDVLDYLQLDIEGYEWHALKGAEQTIRRCQPHFIQVELRNHAAKYLGLPVVRPERRVLGDADKRVVAVLHEYGYRLLNEQGGRDYVFTHA